MAKEESKIPENQEAVRKMERSDSCSSVGTVCCKKAFISKKRIPQANKKEMIRLITTENYSLKEASRITHISYSTAKKLYNELKESIRTKEPVKV